jgi:hypothetical protein
MVQSNTHLGSIKSRTGAPRAFSKTETFCTAEFVLCLKIERTLFAEIAGKPIHVVFTMTVGIVLAQR